MTKDKSQSQPHGNRHLSWLLRGLLLLVSLFFMLFSFDVFSMNGSFLQKMYGFLIHNSFTFIFLIILWLAWKREHLAGFALLAISITMIFFFGPTEIRIGTWMMISLPAIVGFLFLINYYWIKPSKN